MPESREGGPDLSISVDNPTVFFGDVVRGKVTLRPDPVGYAEASNAYITKRGQARDIRKASTISELKVKKAWLVLSCYRICRHSLKEINKRAIGGTYNGAVLRHAIFQTKVPIGWPSKLAVGEVYELPFEVGVPEDKSLPPTWYGRCASDEDFVWQMLAYMKVAARRLPLGYSPDGVQACPLLAGTEIVVTPSFGPSPATD